MCRVLGSHGLTIRRDGIHLPSWVEFQTPVVFSKVIAMTITASSEKRIDATDVHQRALRAEAQFEALLDAAVDAIIQIGPVGCIQRFNKAAEAIFGYEAEEVLGKNVNILMPEPYRGEHDDYLRHYQQTGEARIIGIGREVIGRYKDGREFPIDLSVGEAKLEGQTSFVGIIRDISERKRAEEQLRRQEEELRLIFQNAPTAIDTADLEGNILSANPAFCSLLGYSEQELTHLSYLDITHPEDLDPSRDHLDRLASGESDIYRIEKRYLRKGGEVVHVRLHNSVVRDAEGRPLMLVAEIEDLTAHKQAEEEIENLRERLAHAARLGTLGEVASGIAHELNQPLTAIATHAQASQRMLADQPEVDPDITASLEVISAQAVRAGKVIRRVRGFVGHRERSLELADCNVLLREVLPLAELDARSKGIQLRTELAERMPLAEIDVVQIQQVLLNLIRNATDAMEEASVGDEITVRTHGVGGGVEITVSDRGAGIDPKGIEQIFDSFYTTKAQGLGIGLSLSRSIAEAHGGTLTARNNRYGGATFMLYLPATAEA